MENATKAILIGFMTIILLTGAFILSVSAGMFDDYTKKTEETVSNDRYLYREDGDRTKHTFRKSDIIELLSGGEKLPISVTVNGKTLTYRKGYEELKTEIIGMLDDIEYDVDYSTDADGKITLLHFYKNESHNSLAEVTQMITVPPEIQKKEPEGIYQPLPTITAPPIVIGE